MFPFRRRRGRDVFRPYELAVIDAIRAALSPPAGDLLERQIAAVEMVQRMFDDREWLLYPNRVGPQRHDPSIRFPNVSDDLRLATVGLTAEQGSAKVVVDVVRGHVFQLTFTPSPKALGDRNSIRAGQVTLHVDPMIPDDGSAVRGRLDRLDGVLRAELERIWSDSDPDAKPLSTAGELYGIELDDGEYMVLAQLDDTSYLVAPIDPPRPGVRRFWPDGEAIGDYRTVREALDDVT